MARSEKRKIITGSSDRDRWRSVEHSLQKLFRRSGQFVFGLPPYTILPFYCAMPDVDGVLARAMLPREGKIIEACFAVDSYVSKAPVIFTATLYGADDIRTGFVSTKASYIEKAFTLEVKKGDRLIIDVRPADGVMGVWISLGYQASLERASKERYIKEQFLEEVENAEEAS